MCLHRKLLRQIRWGLLDRLLGRVSPGLGPASAQSDPPSMAGSGCEAARTLCPGSFILGFAVICWIVSMSLTFSHTGGSWARVLSPLKLAPKCQTSPVLLDSGGGWGSEVLTAGSQNLRSGSGGQSCRLHHLSRVLICAACLSRA